jgi:amidase
VAGIPYVLVLSFLSSERKAFTHVSSNRASLNGLYGLRPTMRRVPYFGTSNSKCGYEAIESVLGPLSRSLSGVTTFMKTVADAQPWNYDPTVIQLPWNMKSESEAFTGRGHGKNKLSFGIIKWDGHVMPHPPVLRAIMMVTEALEKAGHEGNRLFQIVYHCLLQY